MGCTDGGDIPFVPQPPSPERRIAAQAAICFVVAHSKTPMNASDVLSRAREYPSPQHFTLGDAQMAFFELLRVGIVRMGDDFLVRPVNKP